MKKFKDLIVGKTYPDDLVFVDYVNQHFVNIKRGDIITHINSIATQKLTLEKINSIIQNSIDTKCIIQVSILNSEQSDEYQVVPIDFETRIVQVNTIQLTEFGALPIFFEGSEYEQVLPFGNEQSPLFVSFVSFFLKFFDSFLIIYSFLLFLN